MKRSFSKLFHIAWEEEKLYYLYVILNFICVGIYSYCIIQVPKVVLNMLEEQKIDLPVLLMLFGLILGSGLIASICKYLYTPIGFRIRYRILHKINMKTLSVPLEDFENPKILDNMWSIMRPASSVDGIQWFFLNVAELSGNLGVIAISIGVLFQLNIWLSLMVLTWIICYSYLTVLSAERIDLQFKESSGSWRRSEYLKDIAMDVAYAKELRVFALKEWFHKQMTTFLNKLKDSAHKMFVVANRISFWDNVYQFLRDIVMYMTLIF
jgi:ABC-type multidrug transport system fused ATPase/permease subunit